jgi:hypothetical protein
MYAKELLRRSLPTKKNRVKKIGATCFAPGRVRQFLYLYFMKKLLPLLILLPFFLQCKTQQNNSTITSYVYVDGNGNLYAISSTSIVYDPVTPEESSTGTYSGGEPYVAPLEQKQFDQIQAAFKKVIADKTGQTTTRSMGTGTLVVLPAKTTYIFEMNSISKKEIEDVILLMTRR